MFQFTHPGRGATQPYVDLDVQISGFNSRTPGGVRQALMAFHLFYKVVSIHAPREGCDGQT